MNKEEMITKMQQLIEKMKEAADAYYNGQEIMSDFEYDALFDELQKLEKETGTVLPESPTFFKVGAAPVDGAVKVTHKYPALSLAKTKSVDDLKSFLGERKGYLSWKLDGLTLVATYIDGKLKSLVTRGNGLVGEDITRNAPYICGVALDIPYKEEVVIRGEALCSYPAFEKINARIENEGDKYKNPRGVASGSVRLLDVKELEEREIHFIPFELVSPKANSVKEEKELIENCGMQFVESHCVDANNIDMLVKFFAEYVERKGYPYPTVKKCVELKAQQYAGIIVTDDNLKQAKQDRDNLASARVAIDKFRKAKKKEMSVNIDLMEKQYKELISIIEGVEKPLQAGIDVYDNEKREKRRQQALKFIQTTVDSLGLRSEYASRLVVKDFYLNLTGTQKEVKEDINKEGLALKAEQDKHDADIQTIRTVVDSVNNSLSTKLDVEEFINVLKFYSVSEVVDNINKRAEQLKEAEKRAREEAERKAKETVRFVMK